jgi:predicted unusual protein kinase regulating ubiquinone biosynthesis (AarF/ABC1/UbiB family)
MSDKYDKAGGRRGKSRVSTTQTSRFLRLTGMTTSIATKLASQRMKRLFQSEEAAAESQEAMINQIGKEIAETLGQMKGAVMKVGQIASQMKDILPPQVAEALSVLQKAAAPMPFTVIRRQLRSELGDDPDKLFKRFDEQPFAAASIGQVHRAETLDGREVVVKVQYPAVRESIDSDMRHLRRILRLGGLLKVSAEVLDALFLEIKQQLQEELDYRQEAEHLREFKAFHADQPWIVIPDVIDELTSDKVLTLSYEPGDDLDTLANNPAYDQELRNLLGMRLFDTIGDEIFRLHAVHCDPHPGNFAFRTDGSLVMYDFGAIKRVPEEDLQAIRRLTQAAIDKDFEALDRELIKLEARKPEGPAISDEFYDGWVDLLMPPFGKELFDFGNSDLHVRLVKKGRKTPWSYLQSFQPSPKMLMLERVLGGHYWTLMRLGVVAAFRDNMYQAMAALDKTTTS